VLVSEVHYPKDLAELLELLRRLPGALLYAGGTEILREQGGRSVQLPPEIICIHALPELRRAGLTERFLEIGAAVTLGEILDLGESALPALLSDAIKGVGTPALRNLATLGGNLACRSRFMDSWAALACLDALVELRDAGGATWMNVNRLAGEDGRPAFPQGGVLTRIRVPLEKWDALALRKVGGRDYPGPDTAVFALAARVDKGQLSEFRLAYAGQTALRFREIETSMLGHSLPLSLRERAAFGKAYREAAAELPAGLLSQFGALVEGALDMLAS
jgi:CO/xanthine dehydrogenase FAD-binding subunit